MTQTVWVTGANGFTGRFMIRRLAGLQPRIRIVGIDIQSAPMAGADAVFGLDLCDNHALRAALTAEPPDIVIHLAGLMPPQTEAKMRQVNVEASVTLAESVAAVCAGKTRIICAGSAAEYGAMEHPDEDTVCKPVSGYGRTKYEQTTRMLAFNAPRLEVIVARPFNLIGPGLSVHLVAGGLCRQFAALDGDRTIIRPRGPIESIRDFVDVRDVAAAYWTLATAGEPGRIYNVCTNTGTTIARLIEILQRAFAVSAQVEPDYDAAAISPDVSVGHNHKLVALGWQPQYSIEDSVAAMVDAYRRHE